MRISSYFPVYFEYAVNSNHGYFSITSHSHHMPQRNRAGLVVMMGRSGSRYMRSRRVIIGQSIASLAVASVSGLIPASVSLSARHPYFCKPVISRLCISSTRSAREARDSFVETSDAMDDDDWSDILPFEQGSHGSAKISVQVETGEQDPFCSSRFGERLRATVTACRELGKSSIWVEVPMVRSSLIESGDMFDLGFRFHHAIGDKSILNLWLRDRASKIPDFSTHNVGVGAVVINSRDEILLVRELRKNYMPWKTPTGLSELGEHIDEAAEREVLEETGIKATFDSIIGFRQTHGLAHGRSDLFFVCRLNPAEDQDENGNAVIPEPVAQEDEIERAEWVPLSEYRAIVHGKDGGPGHPMMSHVIETLDAGRHIQRKVVNSVVPGRKPNAIFYPVLLSDQQGE